jgi:hypothetical protein
VFGAATAVTISGVTIQNANPGTEDGDCSSAGLSNGGGATEELGAGTVTVIDSVIRNNRGPNGGIQNNGGGTMTKPRRVCGSGTSAAAPLRRSTSRWCGG